jgi:non-heme chloroperoxidase
MPFITTKDGTQIFYNDLGKGKPVLFSHGWPLSGDDWERQMLFLAERGYRVIAHDRRSHGRSTQTWDGNHMDQYADDLSELIEKLDLRDLTMIGHSTGGNSTSTSRFRSTATTAPAPKSPKACADPSGCRA